MSLGALIDWVGIDAFSYLKAVGDAVCGGESLLGYGAFKELRNRFPEY